MHADPRTRLACSPPSCQVGRVANAAKLESKGRKDAEGKTRGACAEYCLRLDGCKAYSWKRNSCWLAKAGSAETPPIMQRQAHRKHVFYDRMAGC